MGEPPFGAAGDGEESAGQPGAAGAVPGGQTSAAAPGSGGLTPAEALAVLDESAYRARRAFAVDDRLLYGAWGLAWFGGFGALWLATLGGREDAWPPVWAVILFGCLIALAIAVSVFHSATRQAEIRGGRRWSSAAWGWAWAVAFGGGMTGFGTLVDQIGSVTAVMALYNLLAGLIVGCLYMGAGSVLGDRAMFTIGLVLVLVSAAGALAAVARGLPLAYLVMAVGAGGALGAGALMAQFRVARERRQAGGRQGEGRPAVILRSSGHQGEGRGGGGA
ncbi:MAG: hypothetical protein LBC97_14315 [Bifidobacteriaceae bacterium]|jgi:hypothetical protein|nr:hypothetical protein [Bifidobacteriaceae bacterium]